MIIRQANLNDAEDIAQVHVDSWRTTYKGIIPQEFLNNLSYKHRSNLWQTNIQRDHSYVLVVENDFGEIVGFADTWKRENNTEALSGDLTSIYILEEYQGKGIGKSLLKELFKHFKILGYEKVFVDVLEANNTRYFYEHYGATKVKTIEIKLGDKVLNESIYLWENIDEVIKKLDI